MWQPSKIKYCEVCDSKIPFLSQKSKYCSNKCARRAINERSRIQMIQIREKENENLP